MPAADAPETRIEVTEVDGRPSPTDVAETNPFQSRIDRERKPLDEPTPAELDALITATRMQLARACVARGAVTLDLGCDGWGDALELGEPSDVLAQLYDSRRAGLIELAPFNIRTDELDDWAWRHGFGMPPASERWTEAECAAYRQAVWLAWIEAAMVRRRMCDPDATWPPAMPRERQPIAELVETDWEEAMVVPALAEPHPCDDIVRELGRSWGLL